MGNLFLVLFFSLVVISALLGIDVPLDASSAEIVKAQMSDNPADLALAKMEAMQTNMNHLWTILAAILVFFMQAGFCLLEVGLTRAKNAVNIIMKNVIDVCAGGLVFYFVGFGLMFGTSWYGMIGTDAFFLSGIEGGDWNYTFFLFQAVFAATAATIVSGAVAERTAFRAYLIFSVVLTGLIYPIFGSWAWGSLFRGKGWLENIGFIDFAGSTVVHSVGGWAALAAALVVGPRVGKYDAAGRPQKVLGHSLPLAALGVFILWMGWFGFNAGSTTTADSSIALIAMNTFLAACAGGVFALWYTWAGAGKANPVMVLNGVLAGLVGITAGCANLTPLWAVVAGAVAGVLVIVSSEILDRFVDDAVGAVSVHGVCGAWGTLAAGMFDAANPFDWGMISVQMVGIGAAFLWTFPTAYILFALTKYLIGVRVDDHEQEQGLDKSEHDLEAYPEFGRAA